MELDTQIKNRSEYVKNIYGDDLGNEFYENATNISKTMGENLSHIITTYEILLDDMHMTKQVYDLKTSNRQLRNDVDILKEENIELKKENIILKKEINELKSNMKEMKK